MMRKIPPVFRNYKELSSDDKDMVKLMLFIAGLLFIVVIALFF
jgi:hypothetical protein